MSMGTLVEIVGLVTVLLATDITKVEVPLGGALEWSDLIVNL